MNVTGLSGAPLALSASDIKQAHIVHFYDGESSLIDQIASAFEVSLAAGDPVLAIATEAHRRALERALAQNFDLTQAAIDGRYTALDAQHTLSKIRSGRSVDARSFTEVIGGLIASALNASSAEKPCVTVFGEMVALLWAEGEYESAVRLEQLWNDLGKKYPISLRCAYPMNGFSKPEDTEFFLRICSEHSVVIPEGDYRALFASDDQRLRTIAQLQQRLHASERTRALHESEQHFRLLVEAVRDYAIFMLDPEGHVTTWNVGAERIKGYKASEIIGEHFSRFYPDEDVRSEKPQRELEIAIREGRVEDEGWRIRKDGSKFWANVVITALRDESGNLVGFAKVTRDFTDRVRAQHALEDSERKLQISERSLRNLSLHLLRTQDEERRQIGRDLHDSLGQYLSVVKMKLDALKNAAIRKASDQAPELEQCSQLVNEAVKEVRTISYLLYPPMLEEMGLKTAIPWYLDGFARRSGIKTTFEISSEFGRLDRDVELALFRVLQESLTNVHRHSGSTEATVRLGTDKGSPYLEISDKGKGISVQKFEDAGRDWMGSLGVGLRGMTERMNQIGGRLEISSNETGTIVRAIVPAGSATAGAG